ADERFFQERGERYSNDSVSLRALSNLGTAPSQRGQGSTNGAAPWSIGANTALVNLALFRRDFFFAADSSVSTAPVKQERTEYSMLIVDSVNYPVLGDTPNDDHLTANIGVEFQPSSIVRRSDLASSQLGSGSYSALSSLLAPNEVSSLQLAASGRLDFSTGENLGPVRMPGHSLISRQPTFAAEAKMSYDENSQNVSLLSNEIVGLDPSLVTKLAQTLDEASFSSRTTLADLSMHYAPSVSDLFGLEGSVRLLNYDTPSPNNDDDHDQLNGNAVLAYDKIFSDDLVGGLNLRASQTHLVYLKSDQSAQNNVTQSLDLSSHATYAGMEFFGQVNGEVFANYTVLDYLDSLPFLQSVGNYVLRGMTLSDSTLVPLWLPFLGASIRPFRAAGPITIEDGLAIRVSERGSYSSSAFSEQRDTRVLELSATLLLGLSSNSNPISSTPASIPLLRDAPWSIRVGARGFFQSRYGHSDVSLAAQQTFSQLGTQDRLGPFVLITLARNQSIGPMLYASLWYSVIHNKTYDIPSYTRTPQLETHLQVQWAF
ncbi:MAG TPA: hypothetical protein VG537_00800, partial [Candidatus Kapabacteria bacterium]|nr:hypothetical protein [Candidatus Kapabacteria bacterium]